MSATTVPGFHSINAASRLISSAAFAAARTANIAVAAHARNRNHGRFQCVRFIGLVLPRIDLMIGRVLIFFTGSTL